ELLTVRESGHGGYLAACLKKGVLLQEGNLGVGAQGLRLFGCWRAPLELARLGASLSFKLDLGRGGAPLALRRTTPSILVLLVLFFVLLFLHLLDAPPSPRRSVVVGDASDNFSSSSLPTKDTSTFSTLRARWTILSVRLRSLSGSR
ncbi:unnamed protein product, partial [Ixodes persulcatus]